MARTRVLLVDDEASFRRVLRISLVALGFEVVEAGTGERALTFLAEHPYDVVILDLEMPGMNGIEACRELRRLGHHASVLMLTASESAHNKAMAFEAGANDYITKPFLLRDLVARVRAAVYTLDQTIDAQGTDRKRLSISTSAD